MSAPLRIAFFVGSFPVISETFITRQITGLLDLGHEVDIYSDTRGETGPVHPEVEKYRLLERTTFMDMPPECAPWEMPIWPLTARTWIPGSSTSVYNCVRLVRALPTLGSCFLRNPRLTLSLLKTSDYSYRAQSLSGLYRLAKLSSPRRRYDILHAHFGPVGNSFRFARRLWFAPLVVSFHGYDFSTIPRKEGSRVYEKLFATADLITVNSEYTRTRVEKLGCPAAKIHKLPVGVSLDEFTFRERVSPSGGPIHILTVGRLAEIKGHEYVIRAVAKLQHPSICYDIVGDGPLRPKLQKLVKELALEKIVIFHGAKTGPEVRELMDRAHLFVLASVNIDGDQEGQGLVLQEAQASGLPVLATDHGAFAEGIIPGRSGFLVHERDPDALAERLTFLVQNPQHWAKMGRDGRTFVEKNYDSRTLNLLLLDLYQKAIADFPRSN